MKKHKLCAHCQYFRPPMKVGLFTAHHWCSNSKSDAFQDYVAGTYFCDQFTKKDKKAPLWMRLLVKANSWLKK